jgi:hypothetical protein
MIVVEPLGGLGNQLFVYGLGLAVSRKLGVPVVADLGRIEGDKKRDFELSSFNNSLADIPVGVPVPGGPAYHLFHRALGLRRQRSGEFGNFYYETGPGFDARFLEVPDGSRLRGFFQSYRYLRVLLMASGMKSGTSENPRIGSRNRRTDSSQWEVGLPFMFASVTIRNCPECVLPSSTMNALLAYLSH